MENVKGIILTSIGSLGAMIGAIEPWKENIEWAARVALLGVSIASVVLGMYVTLRKRKTK